MNADLLAPTPPPSLVLSQGLPAALLSGWSCCRRSLFCSSFSFFISSFNSIQSQVAEDRGPELPSATCRCEKATRLCEEIQSLGRRVAEAGQVVTSNSYDSIRSSWCSACRESRRPAAPWYVGRAWRRHCQGGAHAQVGHYVLNCRYTLSF